MVSGFSKVYTPANWDGGTVILADSGGTPLVTLTPGHDSVASICRKLAAAGAATLGGVWSAYPNASGEVVIEGQGADAAFSIYATGKGVTLTRLPAVFTAGPVVTGTASHGGGTYPSGGVVVAGVQLDSAGGSPSAGGSVGASAMRATSSHGVEVRGTLTELYAVEEFIAGVYDIWADAGYPHLPRLLVQDWTRAPYMNLRDPSVMVAAARGTAVIQ